MTTAERGVQRTFMDEFTEAYYGDPVRFVREMLGAEPYPYQVEFLRALAAGERKMSVKSGHGTGKSTTASWAMLWFLLLWIFPVWRTMRRERGRHRGVLYMHRLKLRHGL